MLAFERGDHFPGLDSEDSEKKKEAKKESPVLKKVLKKSPDKGLDIKSVIRNKALQDKDWVIFEKIAELTDEEAI